jgi:thioredoxin reductase (NADPH)
VSPGGAAGRYGLEERSVPGLELVVIGAGAAGLSAAIYAALLRINAVLLDAESGGGLMNLAKTVENLPGVTGKRGPAITEALVAQLEAAGGRINSLEPAQELDFSAGAFRIRTPAAEYRPKAVIIATGLELLGLKEEYGVAGERQFLGKGVSYCAECDAPLFRGKRVLVCGNPFDAFLLKRTASEVTYLGPVPADYARQVPREIIEANVIAYMEGRIVGLRGGDRLEEVVIEGGAAAPPRRLAVDGLFLTRRRATSEVYAAAGIDVDPSGFVRVDRRMQTNVPGVFACGDITGEPWQISKSIGEGAVACLSVFRYLTGQEMRNLGWALQDEWQR